jgi:4-hydroxy-tetrahydrodipicolinate synthase
VRFLDHGQFMARPRFHGCLPALVTPFRDGKVDEAAFRALVKRQMEGGVHGLVPVGTTGESATLSDAEHRRVIEMTVEVAGGRTPVVAGAGSSATARSIELARAAKAAGADALLVAAPPYNRPSQEGLYRHFAAIAEAVELPLILYNVPSRAGVDIATETVVRLSSVANIVGIKDATGDLSRVSLMLRDCPDGFALLSGDDPSAVGYCAQGGHGVISVTSNVAPGAMARLMDLCLSGAYAAAAELQARLVGLHKALFLDASPAPAKFALAELGLCSSETRLPITECAEAVRPAIREAMAQADAAA